MTEDRQDTRLEPEVAKILELLERLAAGEQLANVPLAMGLSQDDARSIFSRAGLIVRQSLGPTPKRWPVRGSLLDWREMSVAEALEILGNLPARQSGEKSE